jgi:hypothetical protein
MRSSADEDRRRSYGFKHLPCPQCGKRAFAIGPAPRAPRRGDLVTGSRDIELLYSQHRCTKCKFFDADTSEIVAQSPPHTVVSRPCASRRGGWVTYQAASWHLWRDHRVFVPFATIQNWVEAGGEKGGAADVDELS